MTTQANLADLILPSPVITSTMHYGHMVDCKVIARDGDVFTCEFLRHHDSGSTSICLDFGAKAFIREGQTFKTNRSNIERAAKLIADALNH